MLIKINKYLKNIFVSWKSYFIIKSLNQNKKKIIFYAETIADWSFLEPIAKCLKQKKINFIKITSDPNDENLIDDNVYFIGYGMPRTILFRTIKASGFIMTLTDLDSFHLKKSIYPVHYFYFFHSLASTHRTYRENAFDAYDTIFCTGKYQINEIRETEKKYNLNKKNLIEQGYVRLDELLKRKKEYDSKKTRIIIAPTWGESSLIEKHLYNLINILISENYFVTLRLHPMTLRNRPNIANEIIKKFFKTGKFIYDSDLRNEKTIINNDIMISDWSGAALEFAFANERPVIFIDMKPKINNKNWKIINQPCFEDYIRKNIGKVVSENDIKKIPNIINELLKNSKVWSRDISKIRDKNIFNVNQSAEIGTKIILDELNLN